ncbi:MAG: glutamate synthase subunit beta [Spirochaetales bacterium]|nr:glutamate synthase subunit beta [Spirochaetales bacterium]
MGDKKGFLKHDRQDKTYRPVGTRIKDYKDVCEYLTDEEMQVQASRCMDCGIPYCHCLGCPLNNLIPEWNDLVYKGKWEKALRRLEKTNPFPEFTGRICPAPCETSCTLSINCAPVSICQIELAIIEHGFREGWVKPKIPRHLKNTRIAVIGSGPAGLAAADSLRAFGYHVVVFEKAEKAGGILRYGIPDFKLEKWVIDRRLELMKEAGVEFETDVNIGDDISSSYLKKSFDVILITAGSREPRDLKIPGRELEGIHFAMDYLSLSNLCIDGKIGEDKIISAAGRNVLVIGGGDTGSDCIGTANRQGAKKVYQFEILPKPVDWKKPHNPDWPEWPVILRTSSSHKEGAERKWSISTKQFKGSSKKIESADFVKIEWDTPQPGSRPVIKEIPGSEFSLQVDLVLLAMGFVHVEHGRLITDLGIELDERGNIKTDEAYATNIEGVYAAGDSNTGSSLVVRAIRHGLNAADSINKFLCRK